MKTNQKAVQWIGALLGFIILWGLAYTVLPNRLPFGPVVYGLVLGGLNAMTAMGLVLIYRSARIINFAQVEIGGVASSVAVVLVLGNHLPYLVAVPIGLVSAIVIGILFDRVVIWRFQNAPRLILTVATIGLSQLLAAIEYELPNLYNQGSFSSISNFHVPLNWKFQLTGFNFNADDVIAAIIVPIVMIALWWFIGRTDIGAAIRASADSSERALLLGIPVRRLSLITWIVAGFLAGVGSIFSQAIIGLTPGQPLGPEVLLAPLAAAAIASFEDLPITLVASLFIGVFEQAIFWSYPKSSSVDVGFFLLIAIAFFFIRQQSTRVSDSGLGGFSAIQEIRPLARAVKQLPIIRILTWVIGIIVLAVAIIIPGIHSGISSDTNLLFFSNILIYSIVAVSLVVLTGWAGQISLGQYAFTGAGASITALFLVTMHWSIIPSLCMSILVGGIIAVIVGIPALRLPGLNLAVITLAFAVMLNTYFVNTSNFPDLAPPSIPPTNLFNRIDLTNQRSFYYICLVSLAIVLFLTRNLQKSRAGRAIRAIRDNERAGSSYGISPLRARLLAFGFAGSIAGLAGGLLAVTLAGIPSGGFDPAQNLQVFTIVVFGGMGSILGGVLGAIFVESIFFFVHQQWIEELSTGLGLTLILYFFPQGISGIAYKLRDLIVNKIVPREETTLQVTDEEGPSTVIPGPAHDAALRLSALEDLEVAGKSTGQAQSPVKADAETALVAVKDIDAGYGKSQVLYGVSFDVGRSEILALLGTNGAGKSTILRVIAGVLKPQHGKVFFEGNDITDLSPIERVNLGLVTVPGGRGVFRSLSVRENLRLAGWLARKDKAFLAEAMARIFTLFPTLQGRLDTRAGLLSGGEQQMLTVAQALLCKPKLLLIDELSLGLAPTVVAELLNAVRALAQSGVTVVVVEQSVNVATAIANRAVFMERGQVRFSGPTPSVEQQPNLLRSVFLRAATRAHGRPKSELESKRIIDKTSVSAFGVHNVSKRYGTVSVLSDITLSVSKGEILGVIGANGAGKTTLFDVCSGFIRPERGQVIMEATDITALRPHQRANRGLGRVFQDAQLFPSLTVAEVLAVALERHVEVKDPIASMLGLESVTNSEEKIADRVDELVEEMGLTRYRNSFVTELSTGTRRVVDLACAMAHRPRVLLLDEPSSGIAQRESEAMGELLLGLRSETGASFIVIEHDVPLVSYISDRLVCLHLGEVIAEGETTDVLNNPDVISAYLGRDDVTLKRSSFDQPQPASVATAAPQNTVSEPSPSQSEDPQNLS